MSTTIQVDVTNWPNPLRIELLELIDQLTAQAAARSETAEQSVQIKDDVVTTGWTYDAYFEVMSRLLKRHFVQAAAIMEAIKTGTGYVPREKVYELGKYPQDRSLKGFTRPVNRVTADVVDAGLLPEDAEELLRPDYDSEVKSFQRARGFHVPMEVVKIALTAMADAETKKRAEAV